MSRTEPVGLDLICLGEPLVEFNQQADGRYLRGCGGDASNCAVAAARQGARVGMITRLGADEFGDAIVAMWRQERVDAQAVVRDSRAPTGIYFVTHGPQGHRFEYRRSGSAASLMRADQLPADYLRRAKALHVSAISQAISASAADAVFRAIEIAREAGLAVSYDTNLRLALWPLKRARAIIHATVGESDILLPGLEDAVALTGLEQPDAIADRYLGLGARIVALTLGAGGVLVATAEQRRRIQALPVEAVDATGAGDAFDGAFLAEYLVTGDPFAAAAYANTAAALAVQGYGAIAPIPRRRQVERQQR